MSAALENAQAPGLGRKIVLLALLGAFAAMFAGSFLYRMQGHGLVVEVRPERAERGGMGGAMGGAMGGVDMGRLRELMDRMDKNPDDPAVLMELGNTFMMMQAWDRALDYVSRAAKLRPEDPEVLRALGMVRFERKEHDLARKAFEALVRKSPDDALAHYNLGILLKHYMNKPQEADAHFRRVVQLAPPNPEVLKSAQEELAAPAGK